MADNVNGRKIKEMDLATTLSDTDDLITEDDTPKTKRVKWGTMKNEIRGFLKSELELTNDDITEIYTAVYTAK